MKKFGIGIIVLLSIIVFSGCVEQFWLADQASLTAVKYAGKDPNDFKPPITTIGNLEKLKIAVAETHIEKQIRLRAQLDTDDGLYSLTADEVGNKIQNAKQQYQTVIGTLEQPGVAWTALTALLTTGSTAAVLRKIWYTEAEHQAEIAKAKAENTTT